VIKHIYEHKEQNTFMGIKDAIPFTAADIANSVNELKDNPLLKEINACPMAEDKKKAEKIFKKFFKLEPKVAMMGKDIVYVKKNSEGVKCISLYSGIVRMLEKVKPYRKKLKLDSPAMVVNFIYGWASSGIIMSGMLENDYKAFLMLKMLPVLIYIKNHPDLFGLN
jgi:hypothetical protein